MHIVSSQDMHHLLLTYREEIIQSKVAKEQIEETLKGELMFMRDQAKGEQQERSNIEETLNQEVLAVQNKLGLYIYRGVILNKH